MKNGAMSVKRLARYLNWHIYGNFLGYNGQLYNNAKLADYIRNYNVMLDYCVLRDKIYEKSVVDKRNRVLQEKNLIYEDVDYRLESDKKLDYKRKRQKILRRKL